MATSPIVLDRPEGEGLATGTEESTEFSRSIDGGLAWAEARPGVN